MRLAAVQLCPWRVKRIEVSAPDTVLSKSQSAKTIIGDLPPSSSVTGMSFSAAARATIFPVSTLPVKVTFRTVGCATSGAPHSGPKPETMLKTPGGSTRFRISQMRSTASGASSALFTTTALPATSAGATFSAISSIGTFHGMMAPTTPSGSRTVTLSTFGAKGTLSPFSSDPRPPKNSKTSATTFASTRLSVRSALPVSSAMSRPSSSTCSFSAAAQACTSAPRLRAGTLAQAFCACAAAATAASTSAASPSAAVATCSPVAGFTTGKLRPDRAGT
jgi:hypothetical protein